MKEVYLDNAATSRHKPKSVVTAMTDYLINIGCSAGRGGYECSLKAGRIVLETRLALAELFNVSNPEQIIFTHNITHAINYALKGLLNKGDHVITTSMEHNSVIRPLKSLERGNFIQVDYIQCDKKGILDPNDVVKAIKKNSKILIITHASNVTGTLMPIKELSEIAQKYDLIFILDTAQTAGTNELDFQKLNLDILCFTGHKGLMGPTGTGGFVINKKTAKKMRPLIEGGTGSISDKEYQPDFLPDKFESGTINSVGIAGLKAALDFIKKTGMQEIRDHKKKLARRFLDGLNEIKKINILGPNNLNQQTATISITVSGLDMGSLSYHLDESYGIMTRSGLHCAPLAHKTIGTFPEGTLRFSIGFFNTKEEIDYTLQSLQKLI